MIRKGSRLVMSICHIIIGAALLLLSTSQFGVVDASPVDTATAFQLEQCGIPAPLFYQPSIAFHTGKSPFDSVCSSDASLYINTAVCNLFKLLALNACSKSGDPQAASIKYYDAFSKERSTLEQVCADFDMIYSFAKSSSTQDSYKLLGQKSTFSTLYYLAKDPSSGKSICSLFCNDTMPGSDSYLVMCKGLDFLLMSYANLYQPKADPEGGTTILDENKIESNSEQGSKPNDPGSKEVNPPVNQDPHVADSPYNAGTMSVTGLNPVSQPGLPGSSSADSGNKADTQTDTGVNPESQPGLPGSSSADSGNKADTQTDTGVNPESQPGVVDSANPAGISSTPSTISSEDEESFEIGQGQFQSEDNFGSEPDAGKDELDTYEQGGEANVWTDEREGMDQGDVYLEKEKKLSVVPETIDLDEEESSSHFMAYSLIAIIIIMATYIMYHNKQRIIAVIIEGRNGNDRRRRNDGYQKLDQNLSDVMPSLQKSKEYKF